MSFRNQEKIIESCDSKQMDYSSYSIASQESTQFSDYNVNFWNKTQKINHFNKKKKSQASSDENCKQYNNNINQNNMKNEIFEESPKYFSQEKLPTPSPQMVFEYASEIFSYLKANEVKNFFHKK